MTAMAFNREDVRKGDEVYWTEYTFIYEGYALTIKAYDKVGRKLMNEIVNRCQAYGEEK